MTAPYRGPNNTFIRDGLGYQVKLSHWLPKRVMHHDAFTWNRTIYVADPVCAPDLHCHEFQHVRQQETMGLFKFALTYLKEIFKGYPKAPNYDTGNRLEVEAYQAQLAYLRGTSGQTWESVP